MSIRRPEYTCTQFEKEQCVPECEGITDVCSQMKPMEKLQTKHVIEIPRLLPFTWFSYLSQFNESCLI